MMESALFDFEVIYSSLKTKLLKRMISDIPTPPQALGDDIEVPFINCVFLKVHFGTEV